MLELIPNKSRKSHGKNQIPDIHLKLNKNVSSIKVNIAFELFSIRSTYIVNKPFTSSNDSPNAYLFIELNSGHRNVLLLLL